MKIENRLIELGLSHSEIEEMGLDHAITYFRFHHNKNYSISTVLFSEMESDKLLKLHELASTSGLKINSRLSTTLSFFCYDNEKEERLKKARKNGTITLTPTEFETIFSIQDYSIRDCKLVFAPLIKEEFRIARPLSNFDQDKEINSFSFDSDQVYTLNLYKQICTCGDFTISNRSKYEPGDIRRLCKHLMQEYTNSFGLMGLTLIQTGIFQNGHSVKTHLDKINLSSLAHPVYINRDSIEEWWNIYVSIDGKTYLRFGFEPQEERFAYNDKPHGHVKELREQLKRYKYQFSAGSANKTSQKNKKQKKAENAGCTSLVLIPIVSILLYILLR